MPDELTAALASKPFGPETLIRRRYKTTDRRVYEENRVAGVDQTLHFNENRQLTESTSMTLVIEKDGKFLTPALGSGLLGGTYRAHLLAEGRLEETVLPVEALASADRIWLVNSVRRWKSARLVPR
jgi:para-aminobenzoate synthetase/4-amino-4-deoxychorismate lyase